MSIEAWTQTPQYTISGLGPYQISHPYFTGAIRATVINGTARIALTTAEFSVTPLDSASLGDLFLSPSAAATHAGRTLIIDRMTPDEQGWLGVQGEREAGLEAQLDRLVQSVQEIRRDAGGAVRIRSGLDAFDWADGTVPLRSGAGVISGPTAAAITAAQGNAAAAAASAVAAAASAADALAKQNSMLRFRGNWITATAYAPSDIVYFSGSSYITLTAHTSGVFATDLSANRLTLFAEKGATGSGAGDMLNADNFSGVTNKPLAYTTIGGRAVGKVDLLTYSLLDPAMVITDVETLAANRVANAVPVAKAVTEFVDAAIAAALVGSGAVDTTLIADFTFAGQTNYDIVTSGDYDWIEVVFINMTPSTTTSFLLRTSADGSSFSNGSNHYVVSVNYSAKALVSAIEMTPAVANAGSGMSGTLKIIKPQSGEVMPMIFDIQHTNGTGLGMGDDFIGKNIHAHRTSTVAIVAARIFLGGGNIQSGKIKVWGVKVRA